MSGGESAAECVLVVVWGVSLSFVNVPVFSASPPGKSSLCDCKGAGGLYVLSSQQIVLMGAANIWSGSGRDGGGWSVAHQQKAYLN